MDKKHKINANPEKTQILYTDQIMMSTNADGVVLDIAQRFSQTNHLQIVSRIGMSREHAKKFVNELSKLLAMTDGDVVTSGVKN